MLRPTEVSELVTKAVFNKLMGFTAKDLPKEDKKAEGYIVTLGEQVIWVEKEAYELSLVPDMVIDVALNPSVFSQLSPLKKKSLLNLVTTSL